MTADPTRRVVLAVTAALPLAAVAGCQGVGALAPPPTPAPAVSVLSRAISAERLMVARYAAVLHGAGSGSRALAAVLAPLLAEHREHLAQLRSRLIVPPGDAAAATLYAPAPGSPSGAGPAEPSGARPAGAPAAAVPGTPTAATAFLRAAEQRASTALLHDLRGVPAGLAQLLASISASEATHVGVLDAARRAA